MASIEERVENLIQKPIEDLGYSLYDVQYVKEGQNYFLRVFIEKEEGTIDLNDCEKVNDGINDILNGKGNKVLEGLRNGTIKGKKLKVEKARK